MINECLICNSKVEYLSEDESMKCFICNKKEMAKIRCVNGHYVCNDCHMDGISTIYKTLLNESSKNPIKILEKLMKESFCHMHGPEHHILVGASLLTAYKNAGGDIDLEESLKEMINRGKKVPGGFCGYYGACGAAISTGIFVSIITDSTPLATKAFSQCNMMTSNALKEVAANGGPRCCKRDSFLSINAAIDFVSLEFNIQMEKSDVKCSYSSLNKQCIKDKCPFYK
ncbi:MAG: SAM-dependent methyltransferase [Methanosphaera sp. rholeuAM130]|nr:DUF5714 domain-containing protein [Methanosphaera sp.]RAP54759.1 MAG: SAM-dependent methyltransferase [Methanosphaera sp. rholeuAM130]